MNNSRWQNLIDAFGLIPIFPESALHIWNLPTVAVREISHISDYLTVILNREITFKTDVNFFTPDESETAMTADEKEFLIRNRKSVLWLLQMDALYQKGMFNYLDAYLQFATKYLQRFTALCNITSSRDTIEQKAAKALWEITRRWFIVFCSDYKQIELEPDETYYRIIQFERPQHEKSKRA